MATGPMMKDWPIELGKYDKIEQVFVSYREFGIQGIAFTIIDAIGRKKNTSFGVKYYNHAMTLKPNEYITQLSGKIKKTEEQTTISSLKVHTNLRPNRLSRNEDKSNSKETKEEEFSELILTRDSSIIVKISATGNKDMKKGGGDGPLILASIGMDVEEEVDSSVLVWDNVFGKSRGVGPLEVTSSKDWSMKLDRCEYIKEIIISHDETTVFGVGFVKIDAGGRITPTQWFGGRGQDIYRIVLKFNEYIVQISGTGTYRDGMIKSLRIYTNLWPGGYRLCGNPFRDNPTSRFSSPVQTSDCIAEYYGTYNSSNLTSIGIVVRETEIRRKEVLIPKESEKKSNAKSDGASIPEMEKKSNVKSEELSTPEREKKSNVKSEDVSIPEIEKKSNIKSEEVSTPETEKKSNIKSEEVSTPETEKKSNVKSEEVLNPETEKKSNIKSEEVSTSEIEKKSNVKSEEVSIPETEKKSNVKSEEVSNPETEKKNNIKTEEVSTPETEKKSNVKSKEVSIPETEKKSNVKSEEVSIPETEKKSNVKSEEVSTSEMETKSNTKSEEVSTSEVEKKINTNSEEASIQKMEKKSNTKSEEPSIPEMEKKSNARSEIVEEK